MGRDSAHSAQPCSSRFSHYATSSICLNGQARRRHLTRFDRLLWVLLSRTLGQWRTMLVIVTPATVLTWHRRGFRLFWMWKSHHRMGRPTVPREIRALIRTMSIANPLWGAPRIPGELLKLGLTVSQATVAKYMVRSHVPPSQTWRTFLANDTHQLIAADFFVVPTVTYRRLFVGVPRPRSPACRARCGDGPSHDGVDGATTAGSLPLRRGSTLSHSRPGSCIRWCACKR